MVASCENESTTRISSAHSTDSMQSPMFTSSLKVVMITDSFARPGACRSASKSSLLRRIGDQQPLDAARLPGRLVDVEEDRRQSHVALGHFEARRSMHQE